MARVKSLVKHSNTFGDKYFKEIGEEYDHPAPAPLVKSKIVTLVEDQAEKTEAGSNADNESRGVQRSGSDALRSTKRNSKKSKPEVPQDSGEAG